MAAPVILIEVSPRRVADGAVQTVRLAGGGASAPYYYGGEHWLGGIASLPTTSAELEFPGDALGSSGGQPSVTAIKWAPADKARLAELAAYFWTEATFVMRIGPEGALPPIAFTGKVTEVTIDGGSLLIALADPAAALKKPVPPGRYAGTGGLEGPIEWEGVVRERVLGRVWNRRGAPIDRANNIYCFADPLRPIQSFDAVRDKGAPAAALTLLGWQGSAAATFAALQAASAPNGGGVICPSIASVKWWTQPAGDLLADIKGEVGGGYVETTAEIAQRLVEALGGPAFAAGTIAAAVAARPAPVGWVVKDDTTQVWDMLGELLGNASLLWLINSAGEIVIRAWAWGASVASGRSEMVSRKSAYRPVRAITIGYRRNETRMARGDIAAVMLSSDVTYIDGTPIENLKPAEAGANVTGVHTAAAIAGQGSLATQNAINLGTQVTGLLGVGSAASGLVNANLTIGANGALAGGGGGQVTITGLGYSGALNATYGAQTGVSLTSGSYGVLSDGNIYTLIGISSAVAGQGPLATAPSAAPYLNANLTIGADGALAGGGGGQVTITGLGYSGALNATYGAQTGVSLTSGSYGVLSDGNIYTLIGISAAVAGQSAWATFAGLTPSQLITGAANLVFNPTGALGTLRWTHAWGAPVWTVDGTGGEGRAFYVGTASPGAGGVGQYQDIPIYAPATYSLQAEIYAGGLGKGSGSYAAARIYIQWLDGAGAHIEYSTVLDGLAGTGFQSFKAPGIVSPAGATTARLWMDIWGDADWACTGALWRRIKLESNTVCTPFSDERTNGAVYQSSGAPIDTLMPAEAGADITGTHTASGIVGQAPAATDASIEAGADVTSLIVGAAEIAINADHTGAVTDALPRTSAFRLFRQGSDVTGAAAWSVSVLAGTISASIGGSTGVLSIDASGGVLTDASVQITAVHGGKTRVGVVKITKALASPPTQGSSGGSAASGGFSGSTSSTSPVPIGAELVVAAGAGGQVTLTAVYDFTAFTVSGSHGEWAQWYRWNGSAWVAVGSDTLCDINFLGSTGDPGTGRCNVTATGLTANSIQRFQLYMRNNAGSITRSITGEYAAVGG